MAKGTCKDLFHGQGNSTVGMPMKVTNKVGKTDPHTSAGKTLPTKKVKDAGWNK